MPSRRESRDVLKYNEKLESRDTVRRHYLNWREEQFPPLPIRCDNLDCRFHTEPVTWNGNQLPLILDHENGNNSDNRVANLRLLCPNCDSQLETRGGANAGRVNKSPGGFAILDKESDKYSYTLPAEPGEFKIAGGEVSLGDSNTDTDRVCGTD